MNKIVYKDVPTGALSDVEITSNTKQDFVNMNSLKDEEIHTNKYATLEKDYFLLDDTFILMPEENIETEYMSKLMSNEEGIFEEIVVITREYTERYTSTGLTIKFDTLNNEYCPDFNIKWYRDEELIAEESYTQNDTENVIMKSVIAYNKIVMTFNKTLKPNRYLRVDFLIDGLTRIFDEKEIVDINVIEEVSNTGEELTINTIDFSIIAKGQLAYIFQNTQPLKLYRNEDLIGSFFISESEQKSKSEYNITGIDYIGLLESEEYMGGIYDNVTAENLIADILENYPYEIDDNLKSQTLNGYLEISSKKVALQQVAFAIGGMIDTTRTEKIYIKEYSNEIKSEILEDRVFRGITTKTESITTNLQITSHEYVVQNETSQIYSETLNGEIKIIFSEPMTELSITGGTIIESGNNYAIISGTGSAVTLIGKPYKDITSVITKENPLTTASTILKVKKIENATLVTKTNVEAVANRLADIYFSNKKITCKIILENENVGDLVRISSDYGIIEARIISLKLDITGKKKYADLTLVGV